MMKSPKMSSSNISKQINYDNLAESQLGQAITFIIIITKVKKQIN